MSITEKRDRPPRNTELAGEETLPRPAAEEPVEQIDPNIEDEYWREAFPTRPYAGSDYTYEEYVPAYRHGWESYKRHAGRKFEEVEHDLGREWEKIKGKSRLNWERAKQATHDAWERVAHRRHRP